MPFVQCRFRIKQVHLAGSAVLKEADDRLGAGLKRRRLGVLGSRSALLQAKQMCQCQGTNATGAPVKKDAARECVEFVRFWRHDAYSTYKNALLAISIWQKSAQARCCASGSAE